MCLLPHQQVHECASHATIHLIPFHSEFWILDSLAFLFPAFNCVKA